MVPVTRLPELVPRCAPSPPRTLTIVSFGHAGNGNLHVNLLYDPADPAQSARAEAALEARCSTR